METFTYVGFTDGTPLAIIHDGDYDKFYKFYEAIVESVGKELTESTGLSFEEATRRLKGK